MTERVNTFRLMSVFGRVIFELPIPFGAAHDSLLILTCGLPKADKGALVALGDGPGGRPVSGSRLLHCCTAAPSLGPRCSFVLGPFCSFGIPFAFEVVLLFRCMCYIYVEFRGWFLFHISMRWRRNVIVLALKEEGNVTQMLAEIKYMRVRISLLGLFCVQLIGRETKVSFHLVKNNFLVTLVPTYAFTL